MKTLGTAADNQPPFSGYQGFAPVSLACDTPYLDGAWVTQRPASPISCAVAVQRGLLDCEIIQLTDNGRVLQAASVAYNSGITTATFGFVPDVGMNKLVSSVLANDVNLEGTNQVAFGTGDWSNDTFSPSPESGSTTSLTPELAVTPDTDALGSDVQITYTVTDPATGATVISSIASGGGTLSIPATNLRNGTAYDWSATITGTAGGRSTPSTVTTPIYHFSTLTQDDAQTSAGVVFPANSGDSLATVVDGAVASSSPAEVASTLEGLATAVDGGAGVTLQADSAPASSVELRDQAARVSNPNYSPPAAPVYPLSTSSWTSHMSGTPQAGYAWNARRTWKYEQGESNARRCNAKGVCTVVDRWTWHFQFDPNLKASRIQITAVHAIQRENIIQGLRFDARVYRNQSEDGHLGEVRVMQKVNGYTFYIPLDTSLARNNATLWWYQAQWADQRYHASLRSATAACSKDWCTW